MIYKGEEMINYEQVQSEIKRVRKIAKSFAKQIAPIYTMFDWWWYRLGRPPNADEIYNQIIYFLDTLTIDETTQDFNLETGGVGLEVKRVKDRIELDIVMPIKANLIDAIQEL